MMPQIDGVSIGRLGGTPPPPRKLLKVLETNELGLDLGVESGLKKMVRLTGGTSSSLS